MCRSWNWKALILCHGIIVFLLITFLVPQLRPFWDSIDRATFTYLNQSLENRPYWQVFWALANHSTADWIEDIFILIFFIVYIVRLTPKNRRRGIANLLFCTVYIAMIILFVNRYFFREYCVIYRDSPTYVLDSSVRLSEYVPWLNLKDRSSKSFPGDHATTAILFAASYAYFAGRKLGIPACCYAIFLCLPRMIAGAHWLSDILIGSGCLTLFFLSWALCTPLHEKITKRIEKLLLFGKKNTQVDTQAN
jgi:Kdo2-lipid A phosphotransferase